MTGFLDRIDDMASDKKNARQDALCDDHDESRLSYWLNIAIMAVLMLGVLAFEAIKPNAPRSKKTPLPPSISKQNSR